VAAVLPKVVPSVTPEEARKCFHESRQTGAGLVTVTVKVLEIWLFNLCTLDRKDCLAITSFSNGIFIVSKIRLLIWIYKWNEMKYRYISKKHTEIR
jgi:hypothetical protein